MARAAHEVNRSDAVRVYLAKHPGAAEIEVVALKRDGIRISASLVAKVKARDARRGGRSRPSVRPVSSSASATGTSKSAAIRQLAESLPQPVRPRDVVAALNEQGITVNPGQAFHKNVQYCNHYRFDLLPEKK